MHRRALGSPNHDQRLQFRGTVEPLISWKSAEAPANAGRAVTVAAAVAVHSALWCILCLIETLVNWC